MFVLLLFLRSYSTTMHPVYVCMNVYFNEYTHVCIYACMCCMYCMCVYL